MHDLGGVGEKAAVLVRHATLGRHLFDPERHEGGRQPVSAIDDDEF